MINKIILVGRVNEDSEDINKDVFKSGAQATKFRLVTTTKAKNKQGEEYEAKQWHNIIAWGKLADKAVQNCKPSSIVCVEGSIETRKYETSMGETKYFTQVNAKNIEALDHFAESGKKVKGKSVVNVGDNEIEDDDIPF